MPNINLLQSISTVTDNSAYFIISNSGKARRFKLENFVLKLQETMPDINRTDQDLFTTTNVTFQSLSLTDRAGVFPINEVDHGLQFESYHSDGSSIKKNDYLGTIRFAGFDGQNSTLKDNELSAAGIMAIALEDWQSSGNQTINAGTGLNFYHQPVNTKLEDHSRVTSLSISSTATGVLQATTTIRFGAIPESPLVVSTSSDGTNTFIGPGRADIFLVNSRVVQMGLSESDTAPLNSTLAGTNFYTFATVGENVFTGYRQPLKFGDSLGGFIFRGVNTANALGLGPVVSSITVHATSDFTSSTTGAGIHVRACSSSSGASPITVMEIHPEGTLYASSYHRFTTENRTNPITITTGTLVFSDSSVQSTAYKGFTSVPTSSTSTGITGQMSYDSSYFYICVATNTWKRILASDF